MSQLACLLLPIALGSTRRSVANYQVYFPERVVLGARQVLIICITKVFVKTALSILTISANSTLQIFIFSSFLDLYRTSRRCHNVC